jgi:Na+-transporting methylmalonyl-CoA/oxaloacetate decarboxylase beta subunit
MLLLAGTLLLFGTSTQHSAVGVIGGADGPTAIYVTDNASE